MCIPSPALRDASDADLDAAITRARQEARRLDRAVRNCPFVPDAYLLAQADAAAAWLDDLLDERAARREAAAEPALRDDTRSSDVYVPQEPVTSPWVERALTRRIAAKPRGEVA